MTSSRPIGGQESQLEPFSGLLATGFLFAVKRVTHVFTLTGGQAIAAAVEKEVVEGARFESEAGEEHQATPNRVDAHAISDLALQNYDLIYVGKPRCSSRFQA